MPPGKESWQTTAGMSMCYRGFQASPHMCSPSATLAFPHCIWSSKLNTDIQLPPVAAWLSTVCAELKIKPLLSFQVCQSVWLWVHAAINCMHTACFGHHSPMLATLKGRTHWQYQWSFVTTIPPLKTIFPSLVKLLQIAPTTVVWTILSCTWAHQDWPAFF